MMINYIQGFLIIIWCFSRIFREQKEILSYSDKLIIISDGIFDCDIICYISKKISMTRGKTNESIAQTIYSFYYYLKQLIYIYI